jgi:hypothetical protein
VNGTCLDACGSADDIRTGTIRGMDENARKLIRLDSQGAGSPEEKGPLAGFQTKEKF